MLFGLAKQGNGPKALLKTNRAACPDRHHHLGHRATLLCVLINYLMPGKAFGLLMALVVSPGDQLGDDQPGAPPFRKVKAAEGVTPSSRHCGARLAFSASPSWPPSCGDHVHERQHPHLGRADPTWVLVLLGGIGHLLKQKEPTQAGYQPGLGIIPLQQKMLVTDRNV